MRYNQFFVWPSKDINIQIHLQQASKYTEVKMTTVQRPQIINHIKQTYYNAADLRKYDGVFFHGTSKGIRNIIIKKSIKPLNIHYATFSKKHGWKSSPDQSDPPPKAKLLLLESWVVTNCPKMMPESDESIEELYEYPEVPPILYLKECEKFKDDDGKVADIETRGDRTPKGIYFSAKDVMIAFEMHSLSKSVYEKTNVNYVNNIHYKTFTKPKVHTTVNGRVKQLYITYTGMLKILFCSRCGIADKFVEWATDTIFTVQMGSEEHKVELGSKIIGQSVKNVRAVFKTCSKKVPCIYQFSLGTAETLRKSMSLPDNIKDDFIIIKYGLTEDLDRRSAEHVREYEKIDGVKLGLMEFSYIDPKFLSEAEVDIKDFFNTAEIQVKYENYSELVAIDPKHEKQIKKQYKFIATEYQGSIKDLIDEIKELKTKIIAINRETEFKLIEKDHIIEIKDHIIQLKDRDLKYEQLRNEMLEMKLKHA